MKNLLRECLFSAYIITGGFKATQGKLHGSFHTWGTCVFDGNLITVAIVEGANGKVFSVQPDYIEFIENTSFNTGQRIKS